MSKFTPGPWVVLPLYGKYYGTEIQIGASAIKVWTGNGELCPSQRELARGWTPDDGMDHVETETDYATSRLIAAAPEMAEEIEDEIFWLEVVSCYGENAERGRMLRIKTLRALLARINEVSKETVK